MFLLLSLISIAALIIIIANVRKLPKPARKWLYVQIGIGICGISLLFILMIGRIHWLGIIIGALIPILKALLVKPSEPRESSTAAGAATDQQAPAPTTATISIKEALDILGLEGDLAAGEITPDMVIDTHRKLIQKFHPDRGGNDYLAAKINQAKEVLLKALAD